MACGKPFPHPAHLYSVGPDAAGAGASPSPSPSLLLEGSTACSFLRWPFCGLSFAGALRFFGALLGAGALGLAAGVSLRHPLSCFRGGIAAPRGVKTSIGALAYATFGCAAGESRAIFLVPLCR